MFKVLPEKYNLIKLLIVLLDFWLFLLIFDSSQKRERKSLLGSDPTQETKMVCSKPTNDITVCTSLMWIFNTVLFPNWRGHFSQGMSLENSTSIFFVLFLEIKDWIVLGQYELVWKYAFSKTVWLIKFYESINPSVTKRWCHSLKSKSINGIVS